MGVNKKMITSLSLKNPRTFFERTSTKILFSSKAYSRISTITNSQISEPANLNVKSLSGELISDEKLQLRIADPAVSIHIVHRYVKMYQQNKRQGSSNTKTRSEVRGGGKKPYTQKKTGNARRGTNRSPLRPGGGVLFGPKPRSWVITMSKKEKRLAMATALQNSAKIMTVVDNFEINESKTKSFLETLKRLNTNPNGEKILLIALKPNRHLELSTRNVKMLTLRDLNSISIIDVLIANKIILDKHAVSHINNFYGPKNNFNSDSVMD